MAPGAQHPGSAGAGYDDGDYNPQPPVTIVRCRGCAAPLYVYNEDNENCGECDSVCMCEGGCKG